MWLLTRRGKPRWVSHRSRALWLPAYAFAVVMLGTTLPTPLYPRYEREFGFSPLLITVIYGVYAAGVIAALLLLGGVSDQAGRRPALFASIILSAASAIAFLLAGGLWALLVGRILSGFSAGLCTGSATAALVDLAPDRRSQASALATAVNLGGLGCGTLLAGLLATVGPAPLRLPFWVDLGLLIGAFAAVLRMVEPVRRAGRPWLPAQQFAVQRLHVPAQVQPTFIRAAAAGFAAFALFGLFSAVAPTFLASVLHQTSPALAGGVVFVLFASSAVGQLAVPRIPGPAALPGLRRDHRGRAADRCGARRQLAGPADRRRYRGRHRSGDCGRCRAGGAEHQDAGRTPRRGGLQLFRRGVRRGVDPHHRGRAAQPGHQSALGCVRADRLRHGDHGRERGEPGPQRFPLTGATDSVPVPPAR